MVIAADRSWATTKAVDFARYAAETGADLLMVLPPDWVGSCTSETLVQHYAAVARHIPVMVVTNLFTARGPDFGLETLRMLRDKVEGVVAIKDDMANEFGRKLSLIAQGRWPVISGGQKQHHLNALHYGCEGFLSTFITFKPENRLPSDYKHYPVRSRPGEHAA